MKEEFINCLNEAKEDGRQISIYINMDYWSDCYSGYILEISQASREGISIEFGNRSIYIPNESTISLEETEEDYGFSIKYGQILYEIYFN